VLRYRRVPLPASRSYSSCRVPVRLLGEESSGVRRTATISFKFSTVVRGLSKMARSKCFFDIDIGGVAAGRVIMEVRMLKWRR